MRGEGLKVNALCLQLLKHQIAAHAAVVHIIADLQLD
jgi:hypothetical protein